MAPPRRRIPLSPRSASPDISALSRAGSPMDAPRDISAERATIIGHDPSRDAYRVRTSSGRNFVCARIKGSPNDNSRLPLQTQVVVDYRYGAPYITGILPNEYAETTLDNPANLTDTDGHGGEDPTYQRNLRIGARAAGEPQDLMPGDSSLTSSDGSSVAALTGKVALLRGSPLAQIRAMGQENLLHLVSGLFRHDSWMGRSEIVNESGKTSYSFKGGADQLNETGPDAEKFTIHLDVGDRGDLINLRVTTVEGETLFRFHVSAQGGLEIYAREGIRQLGGQQGSSHPQQFMGNHSAEVDGNQQTTVSQQSTLRTSDRVVEVTDNDRLLVGNDRTFYVGRDETVVIGGGSQKTVAGHSTLVSSGNISLDSTGGVAQFRGERGVTVVSPAPILVDGQNVTLRTPGPDSIVLGEGAVSHAVMHEELAIALAPLIADYNQFKAAVAAHVHPVTTAPGTTAPAAELAAVAASSFALDLSAARSRWVKLK